MRREIPMNIGNNLQHKIMANAVLSTEKSDTKYSKAINLTIQKKEKAIGRLNSQ